VKISPKDTVLGLPAIAVRDFFRKHEVLASEFVEGELGLTGQEIEEFLAAAEREGLAQKRSIDNCLELTSKGLRFAPARTRSIRRSTAARALEQMLLRAKAINDAPYLYRVQRLAVFGSYLSDAQMLSDLDVAYELKRRVEDEEYAKASKAYIRKAMANGRSFSNLTDELYWPQTEVKLKLKAHSPVISLHEFNELVHLAAPYKIVFEADRPLD
jgi:hypothetical protein